MVSRTVRAFLWILGNRDAILLATLNHMAAWCKCEIKSFCWKNADADVCILDIQLSGGGEEVEEIESSTKEYLETICISFYF
ncbi:hypothetical protein RclHR1_00780011 [Rhizophagus clarus]|uniref:Uncharacterized protein n=1 Tax=Rhizophagus clarus TaxID=94130 RepID=A0A2Z6S096_9GLOM|nr:hypothetical protein RclHR1_00780011 [Rhizophagus clarus]GES87373.1 hypothetical protein RCL_jg22228.t1 [Rhizophagus clarus]